MTAACASIVLFGSDTLQLSAAWPLDANQRGSTGHLLRIFRTRCMKTLRNVWRACSMESPCSEAFSEETEICIH